LPQNALETQFATNRSTFDLGGTQAKTGTLNQSLLTQGAAAFKQRGGTTSSQKPILTTEEEDNDKEGSAKSSPGKAKGETSTSSDDSTQLLTPNPTQTVPSSPEVRRRPLSPSTLSQFHTSKVVDIEKEILTRSPENMDLDHVEPDPNLIPVDSLPAPSPEPPSTSLGGGYGKDVEMVVSTSHTIWSQALKPPISQSLATSDVTKDMVPSDVEDGPPRKKRKCQEAIIPRQESKAADEMILEGTVSSRERPVQRKETLIPPRKNPKAARECLRNRLASFASGGSQASVRLEPSDDDDDDDDDDALLSGSNVGGRPKSREGSRKNPTSTDNFRVIEHVGDEIAEDDDDDDPSSVLSQARLTTSSSPSLIPQERVPHPEILKTTDSASDVSLRFDTDKVVNVWRQIRERSLQMMQGGSNKRKEVLISSKVLIDAGVSNTENDERAVDALARVIEKEDFASMDVVGQFNLGFIIARRRKNTSPSSSVSVSQELQVMDDLFIVDQHASDEEYNFETLQLTTRIQSQKLFRFDILLAVIKIRLTTKYRPQPLELTAADELLATENIEVLRQNGFEIEVDDSEYSGQGSRLKLVAQPISKSTVFDMKGMVVSSNLDVF
jgi:DNA mismatch repair protein PMS2